MQEEHCENEDPRPPQPSTEQLSIPLEQCPVSDGNLPARTPS
eukprot:gene26590-biopygen16947